MNTLSIITINKNNAIGLEKTLASVIEQTYKNISLIVIDGASNDGSVNIINKFIDNSIDGIRIRAIVEPDSGIYNAMNKGLEYSTGDYIFFLNSGDVLYDKSVIAKTFSMIDKEDVFYGNICVRSNNKLKILRSNPLIRFSEKYQHDLPPHPAIFIKKQKILDAGGFDENYRFIADVVLIAKVFSDGDIRYKFIDTPITIFCLNGISSNPENGMLIYEERKKFIQDNFPHYIIDFERVYKNQGVISFLSKWAKGLVGRSGPGK